LKEKKEKGQPSFNLKIEEQAMEISRHARNNMRLYNISEKDILNAIDSPDVSGREGDKVVVVVKMWR